MVFIEFFEVWLDTEIEWLKKMGPLVQDEMSMEQHGTNQQEHFPILVSQIRIYEENDLDI